MKDSRYIIVVALIASVLFMGGLQGASANLVLDHIQFDPAIIAAGDEVDIVIQFHDEARNTEIYERRLGNPDYSFRVMIEPDDTLTEKYVIFQDSEGDDLHGSIFAGATYNKKFRVKVGSDAPAGSYEFKLTGQWYLGEEPVDEVLQYVRFTMPVKKEGIILDVTTLETVPAEVRPGDKYVKVKSYVENVGEKDAKSVELSLNVPEGLSASYSNNNRVWVGRVNSGEKKEVTFFLDVDEKAAAKVYDMSYSLRYMDLDNNVNSVTRLIPFLVKERPYLEVVSSEGEGLAGATSKLVVKVKNTGQESAEAVDVRILKQNSQPFTVDVRSDYIGELEPGEEGIAVFDIGVNRDAEIKSHDFKILIRSKGDTDEGDDNIYIYNRRAAFDVKGVAPNRLKTIGIVAFIAVVLLFIANKAYGRMNERKKRK